MNTPYDICVIGGGINGVGIARDAAGRGLSVLLVEGGDIASATSSWSSKLIHGGLRYLENYDFRLVRAALKERDVLRNIAPHLVHPLPFLLPHSTDDRPVWMLRLGMFLYDHLYHHALPKSVHVNLKKHAFGVPLQDDLYEGFAYMDCQVDDARLAVLNAVDAKERGADVLTHVSCVGLKRGHELWSVFLRNMNDETEGQIQARAVVNAAGPWTRELLDQNNLVSPIQDVPQIRKVKGSHIVVPKLYEGPQAYILQNDDGRVVFVIPWLDDFSLIGTTDVEIEGDPAVASISQEEVDYLCDAVNGFFKSSVGPEQIIWTFSGVRPLMDDGDGNASSVSRDYKLVMDAKGDPPILSIFGGKITTYRSLSEKAVTMVCDELGHDGQSWTSCAPLPGGDIADFDPYLQSMKEQYSWIPEQMLRRCVRAYGRRVEVLWKDATCLGDLGDHYGDGIYESELKYLINHEFALNAEDVLWRRSKMGLTASVSTIENVEAAMPRLLRKQME